jgi:hypothetical protein
VLARLGDQAVAQRAVGEQLLRDPREGAGVARAEAQPDLPARRDDLAQPPGVGHDARAARRHRLERHEAEGLVDRRHHAQVGDPVERVQDVVAGPADECAVLHQAELPRLGAQLRLRHPRARHDEADGAHPVDEHAQRVERQVKALLVHQPSDQQDELLVRRGEPCPQAGEVGDRLQVVRIDPVRDHGDARRRDPERVCGVLPHVGRARDDPVGRADHPPLHRVDVRLGVLLDPAAVPAVLRRVDRHDPRHLQAPRDAPPGRRHQPVVRVDEVEAATELEAGRPHVAVHPPDPGDEGVYVLAREVRLRHAVDDDPVPVLGPARRVSAREDVHLDPVAHQPLGQLAHVPRQPALDHRRVLPADHQDAGRAHGAA